MVAIGVLAVLIGTVLSLLVRYLFGADSGGFFARFIAAPAGLAGAFILFILYVTLFPAATSAAERHADDEQ